MPRAFLSSVYAERLPGEQIRYFRLRRSIFAIGREEGVPVWVAECGENPLTDEVGWVEAVKGCVDELSESDLLIVVLASRSGNPVELRPLGRTASSIFEVELFHASNWRIPTVFFVARGYEPEPELLNLINILCLKDNNNWFVVEEPDIEIRIRELLRHLKGPAGVPMWAPRFVPDVLAERSGRPRASDEIESTALSFIGRFPPMGRNDFSAERYEELLGLADPRSSGGNRFHQLSFLWMAMRELSIGTASAPTRLPLWRALTGHWSTAGAWLGLHGFLNTGVVAAFHTEADLRVRGAGSPVRFGGYASELYSMGRLAQTRRWKVRLFTQSAALASRQMRLVPTDRSGSLSIRASAKMQLALIGQQWLAPGALLDYQRAFNIRKRSGADNEALGEALVELAYAQFQLANRLRWKWQAALARMREGVRLQEAEPAHPRAGFVVRAKRKFAECLALAGERDEAEKELLEAASLAKRFGLWDQVRQIREMRACWSTR